MSSLNLDQRDGLHDIYGFYNKWKCNAFLAAISILKLATLSHHVKNNSVQISTLWIQSAPSLYDMHLEMNKVYINWGQCLKWGNAV